MLVSEALLKIKTNGYKITEKRKEILTFLSQHPQYVSGSDVIQHLKNDHPGLSYDTVYRNLALCSELGILEETEFAGEKKYQLCAESDHHHHFICLKCGETRVIKNCPIHDIPEMNDFHITGHKFEVYGYCRLCKTP
ncbi:Fur family transcriptional regulator [Barrientosiimonas marina]|uniref:Fur family transcriptional regulator n=1 Tax=Lentibacillus kimchii TaxID=1542911 RepID=A0ABW2USM9_9BACI